jgi:hypothetical protein
MARSFKDKNRWNPFSDGNKNKRNNTRNPRDERREARRRKHIEREIIERQDW